MATVFTDYFLERVRAEAITADQHGLAYLRWECVALDAAAARALAGIEARPAGIASFRQPGHGQFTYRAQLADVAIRLGQ